MTAVIRFADAQQFHQVVVGREAGRLNHEHILAADVFVDLDEHFLVGEAAHAGLGQLHVEIVRDRLGERQVGVAGQQFHCNSPSAVAPLSQRGGPATSLFAPPAALKRRV